MVRLTMLYAAFFSLPFISEAQTPPKINAVLNSASLATARPVEPSDPFDPNVPVSSPDAFVAVESLATIFGENLADTTCSASAKITESLCGVTLSYRLSYIPDTRDQLPLTQTITGPVSILFVSPNQINFIAPDARVYSKIIPDYHLTNKTLTVTNSRGTAVIPVELNFSSGHLTSRGEDHNIGIFTQDGSGRGLGTIQRYPSYQLVKDTPQGRTTPGEYVVAWATGMGEARQFPRIENEFFLKFSDPKTKKVTIPSNEAYPIVTFARASTILGVDQYNLHLPSAAYFRELVGASGDAVVGLSICRISDRTRCSNQVDLPISIPAEAAQSTAKKGRTKAARKLPSRKISRRTAPKLVGGGKR